MLKRRVQIFIGEEASRALDALMVETGEGQTALIERMLIGSARRSGRVPIEPSVVVEVIGPEIIDRVSNFQSPERAARKAARVERKTSLQKAVAETLPARGEALAQRVAAIADKVEEVRPHTFHSGARPIPGCSVCAGEARLLKEAK